MICEYELELLQGPVGLHAGIVYRRTHDGDRRRVGTIALQETVGDVTEAAKMLAWFHREEIIPLDLDAAVAVS